MANIRRNIASPLSLGLGEIGVDRNKNVWLRVSDSEALHLSGVPGSMVRVIGGPGQRVVVPSANNISASTTIKDAADLITNTTNFAGKLSAADTNVQLALDTLDDHVHVHSTNTSLTADDHTQYALLAGRVTADTLNNTRLVLPAGTTAAGTAPVKFLSGPLTTITVAGQIEFLTDDYWVGISTSSATGISQYPPAQSDTYVKATTKASTSYWPYYATDPTITLVDGGAFTNWASGSGVLTNQRFHIDLGSAKTITKIYYENYHVSGGNTNQGVKNFTIWGSNDAADFADLVYANNGTWTQLTASASQFDQHVAANTVDPKYITITNSVAYRYYALKFADNWGDVTYGMALRRVELQSTDDPLVRKGIVLTDGSNLTSGRVPYATTNGRLIDASGFTFSGTRLTSYVTLPAGTASAGTAPLVFTAGGVVLTTPLSGALEAAGDLLYYTIPTGPTRKTVAFTDNIPILVGETRRILLNRWNGNPSTTSGSAAWAWVESGGNADIPYSAFGFAGTTYIEFQTELPDDYNGGTVTAIIKWMTASADANVVQWSVDARVFHDGDAINSAFGTAQVVTDTNQGASLVHVTGATPAITIAGTPAAGDMLSVRVARTPLEAADTLDAEVRLISVQLIYTVA